MASLDQLTPFVPVSNMCESLAFFNNVLGFTTKFKSDGYAFVSRDSVSIRLILVGAGKDLEHPNSQQHCYIDVTDVDALYRELEPQLQKLPAGRVRSPYDTEYGQREFHVIDPDALLISFGERINKTTKS